MPDFGADGTVVHSTDLNKIFKVSGVAALTASPPSAGASSGYLHQAGSLNNVTTDANGRITVTYPTAFPTGVVAPSGSWGDEVSSGFQLEFRHISNTQFTVRVVNSSGVAQASRTGNYIHWQCDGW